MIDLQYSTKSFKDKAIELKNLKDTILTQLEQVVDIDIIPNLKGERVIRYELVTETHLKNSKLKPEIGLLLVRDGKNFEDTLNKESVDKATTEYSQFFTKICDKYGFDYIKFIAPRYPF